VQFQQGRPGNGQKTGYSGRNSWTTLAGRAIITYEWDFEQIYSPDLHDFQDIRAGLDQNSGRK